MTVSFPEVTDLGAIPTGDMPGDKVQITADHVGKAQVIFFSMNENAKPWMIWTWPWTVRWDRIATLLN